MHRGALMVIDQAEMDKFISKDSIETIKSANAPAK
jgi:hypothetical protein